MKRFRKGYSWVGLWLFILPLWVSAQQVTYTEGKSFLTQHTEFEIIGKYEGQILIYFKNYSSRNIIAFDEQLNPVDTLLLDFLPANTFGVRFLDLKDRFVVVYQYNKKRNIYCAAVLFNEQKKKIRDPLILDSIIRPSQVMGDQPYISFYSENKEKIMVYKAITERYNQSITYRTFLLDSELELLQKGEFTLPFWEDYQRLPMMMSLANNGNLYFLYSSKDGPFAKQLNSLSVYLKPARENELQYKLLSFKNHPPSESLLLSVNDSRQELMVNSFNFDENKKRIASLFTYRLGMNSLQSLFRKEHVFSEEERKRLAKKKRQQKEAFDRFEPRKVIFSRSGAALLIAEKHFVSQERDSYGDIGLFNLNEEGNMTGIDFLEKKQLDYPDSGLGSFLLVNEGRIIHLLVNEFHQVSGFLKAGVFLLRDYQYHQNIGLEKQPVMKNMDKGHQWIPQQGKQIGLREVLIPCISGGSLIFGRIGF